MGRTANPIDRCGVSIGLSGCGLHVGGDTSHCCNCNCNYNQRSESRIDTSLRARARQRAREIIEEFSPEMPKRVLPEKCQWRYRLLISCSADGEAIQTSLSALT
jgi:hypothetical protein